jgi:hypothetical protein
MLADMYVEFMDRKRFVSGEMKICLSKFEGGPASAAEQVIATFRQGGSAGQGGAGGSRAESVCRHATDRAQKDRDYHIHVGLRIGWFAGSWHAPSRQDPRSWRAVSPGAHR